MRRRSREAANEPPPPPPRSVTVYDIPSNLGGSFTVSIVEELEGDEIKVRVWYGRAPVNGWEPWKDWDGYSFKTSRGKLSNSGTCRYSATGLEEAS